MYLRFRNFLLALIFLTLYSCVFSQGTNCSSSDPFCTGTTYTFNNNTGTTSQSGPNYGCLITQPNPAWYFLKIAQAGNLDIHMDQKDNSGNGIDVDFICWGPYTSVSAGCSSGLTNTSDQIDCSYSTAATEDCNIANAQVGEFYILLLTNYSNQQGVITFSQTGGNGKTDCSVLCGLNSTANADMNVTCFSGSDGAASVSGSGGTPGYNYNWSNGSNSQNITGVSAGIYDVTVSDQGGCTSVTSVTITESDQINTHKAFGDINCNGSNDGVIVSWADGGTGNFTYLYSNGETNNAAFNLSPGSYTLTVTDVVGCTATATTDINEPPILIITATGSAIACNATSGTITASTNGGGTGTGYTFSIDWNNWQTGNVFSGLSSGTFNVYVKDSKGCWAQTTADITNSSGVTTSIISQTDINCFGGNNGSLTVSGAGGTGIFDYSIDGGVTYQTSGTFNNLTAGNYNVTVRDGGIGGCQILQSVNITEPTQVTPNVTSSDAVCGSANGSLNVAGSNGTPGYSYSIDGVVFQSAGNFNNLAPATYTITIKDSQGCTNTDNAAVVNSAGTLSLNIFSWLDNLCYNNSSGNVTVAASGTSGYTYSIDGITFQASPTFDMLVAGTYTITAEDINNCIATTTITITQPVEIKVTSVVTDETCGQSNGQINLSATGGTTPYQYSLDGITFNAGNSFSGLTTGTYKSVVKDANGCVAGSINSINSTGTVMLTVNSVSNAVCFGGNTGSANVSASGSTGYSYSIDGINFQASGAFNNLTAGTYTINVKDAGNCTDKKTITITEPADIKITDLITDETCGQSNGQINLSAAGGTSPFQYSLDGITFQYGNSFTGLTTATYSVAVKDANGCVAISTASVKNVGSIALTINSTINVKCFGGNTGSVTVSANGSTGYSYSIDGINFQASGTFTNLTAGTYTVNAKDGGTCADKQVITITQPPVLTSSLSNNSSICAGQNTTIISTISGGSCSNYTYNWQPGNNSTPTLSVSPTANTTYTFSVTDCNGCTTPLKTVDITVNPLPVATGLPISGSAAGCVPMCITFKDNSTVSGGAIVSWSWDFGDAGHSSSSFQDPNYCYQAPGKYTVTLIATSNKGCSNSVTYNNLVTVYPNPSAAFRFSPDNATIDDPQIQFADNSNGAVKWFWNFGSTADENAETSLQNPNYVYPDTGTYLVKLIVQNLNGCMDSTFDYVIIRPEFTFYIPSAFTPNDDGKNEFFKGEGMYIKQLEMLVFDRWGDQIFKSNDINKGWDGKANGGSRLAQQDVYLYVVSITDILGKSHRYQGHVTLVR